jgi:hypothetical protein
MKPTLLILAAGIGSRYGGLKQVDGMGPSGEAIIEYSIYDALRAGFGKIVFVIRKDIEAAFREKIGSKVESRARVEYAFQEMTTGLEWLPNPPERQKPWGTAHAMLAARDHLQEPFAVINADDFYGADAFQKLSQFLQTECSPTLHGMVAYRLGNTLSENGSVSRGVCQVSPDGFLTAMHERTQIERFPEGIAYVENGERHPLTDDTYVSMNFFGFHPAIMPEIETQFRDFVEKNMGNPKAEFFIPLVVNRIIQEGKARMRVLSSNAQWFGVTYTADKELVQGELMEMVEKGVYGRSLWQ